MEQCGEWCSISKSNLRKETETPAAELFYCFFPPWFRNRISVRRRKLRHDFGAHSISFCWFRNRISVRRRKLHIMVEWVQIDISRISKSNLRKETETWQLQIMLLISFRSISKSNLRKETETLIAYLHLWFGFAISKSNLRKETETFAIFSSIFTGSKYFEIESP